MIFFFDHHFLHKMHGLDNMIHMYIIVYQFQFLHVSITGPVSPLSSPPLCKHARCEIPWAQHAWHPGDFWNLRSNLDAINVISAMFKTAVGDWFCSPFGALINKPVYCNQMDLEHCWYESSTWTDVWHTEWWTMVRFLTGCLAQCFRYSFGALAPC